ncbi:unnamed protein product [Scytosiphon promiscuus]
MDGIEDEDLELLDLFSDEPNASSSNPQQQHSHSASAPPPRRHQPPPASGFTPRPPPPPPPSNSQANRLQQKGRTATPPSVPLASRPSPSGKGPRRPPPPPDFAEAFSGLRVRNRLLSADDMSVRMKGRKVHRLSGLRAVSPSTLESQDPADAWATLGVLVSKSPRRQAANGGSYSIWTLSDLSRKENDVSVFLFQEALSSHWTVCEGMLVARLALSVDVPWQINRVGMSMDYGLCKGKRKDGKACTMPVNKAEGGGYCEFHVVAAFNRAQRKEPLRDSRAKGGANGAPTGSGGGNSKLNSVASLAAASARTTLPASCGAPGHRAPQAPPSRAAPAHTLSGILGAGARRREDPLRPSALRASGRTTMLVDSDREDPAGTAPGAAEDLLKLPGREEGALGKEAPPPKEAHPAGYMNGTVAVPAESSVFLQMAQRFPAPQHTSPRKGAYSPQVLANQRAIKFKAEAQGIQLRPRDPNSSVGAGVIGKKTGGKSSAIGNKRTNGILGAAGRGSRGGGADDPLAKKVKTLSAVEKELLLRRVSKYAGLAEEERAKDADRSVQRLEQREAMADKAEEVTKMTVTVFDCRQCKTRRSHFNKRCRDLGHDQKGVKATLRFFECTNCRKRRSSTDRMPQTGCEGCGRHNMWKRCGARPGRGPADGPRDKRFVAAMSEWTDQRDLSLAAPDFR